VPASIIEQTEVLLGLGLCDDWRFEEALRDRSGCSVVCFDHTVNTKFWVKLFASNTLNIAKGTRSWGSLLRYLEYRRFFSSRDKIHRRQMIGYHGLGGVTLEDLRAEYGDRRVFFKIDIEGWEYRVISDLPRWGDNLVGLAIEFHDVDLHRERISEFIELMKPTHPLVHLHANNIGGLDPSGDPLAIEATFVRADLIGDVEDTPKYPIAGLDFPNGAMADPPLTFG